MQANLKAKVSDPISEIFVAINKYLQAYHMYRAEALSRCDLRFAGSTPWAATRWRPCRRSFRSACSALTAPFAYFGARGEAPLHGALGKQPENCGRSQHHLHKRHREPDEDYLQVQGEEDQQPSIVWRQHTSSRPTWRWMLLSSCRTVAHDLDATGMPYLCIGVGLLGFLLGLPEKG